MLSRWPRPARPRRASHALDLLALDGYRYFHVARADLLRRVGRSDEARQAYVPGARARPGRPGTAAARASAGRASRSLTYIRGCIDRIHAFSRTARGRYRRTARAVRAWHRALLRLDPVVYDANYIRVERVDDRRGARGRSRLADGALLASADRDRRTTAARSPLSSTRSAGHDRRTSCWRTCGRPTGSPTRRTSAR